VLLLKMSSERCEEATLWQDLKDTSSDEENLTDYYKVLKTIGQARQLY
jgi:hypothetical protein